MLAMHEPARGVAADLAGVERDRADQFGGRVADVDIIEHHGRAFAAQFQFHGREIPSARFGNQSAHFGRAGEAHPPQARMARHGGARRFAEAGDDVDDAVRQADFLRQLAQVDGRQRRVLGRLDHHRVAGRQRRRDSPADQQERKVPRKDKTARSPRMTHRPGFVTFHGQHVAPVDMLRHVGEVSHRRHEVCDVALRLRFDLAGIERFDLGDDR